ncbi:hypothetical protein IV203_012988 [Nitzschia inconspicua]|uniref:AP2/ERF domain-containing protein n=1 Tax=Nitzschia inconspicua TaxID=303405 RepID=A0A9K3M520_9STRA|nr:hypothetical protein IV203_012988 [Nitzschia inconspicua]
MALVDSSTTSERVDRGRVNRMCDAVTMPPRKVPIERDGPAKFIQSYPHKEIPKTTFTTNTSNMSVSTSSSSSSSSFSFSHGILGLQRVEENGIEDFIPISRGQILGRMSSKFCPIVATAGPLANKRSPDESVTASSLRKKQRTKRNDRKTILHRLYSLGIPANETCISRQCLEVVTVSSQTIVLKRLQQDFEGHESLPIKVLRLKQQQQQQTASPTIVLTKIVLPNDTVTLKEGDTLMIMNQKYKFQVVAPPTAMKSGQAEEKDCPVIASTMENGEKEQENKERSDRKKRRCITELHLEEEVHVEPKPADYYRHETCRGESQLPGHRSQTHIPLEASTTEESKKEEEKDEDADEDGPIYRCSYWKKPRITELDLEEPKPADSCKFETFREESQHPGNQGQVHIPVEAATMEYNRKGGEKEEDRLTHKSSHWKKRIITELDLEEDVQVEVDPADCSKHDTGREESQLPGHQSQARIPVEASNAEHGEKEEKKEVNGRICESSCRKKRRITKIDLEQSDKESQLCGQQIQTENLEKTTVCGISHQAQAMGPNPDLRHTDGCWLPLEGGTTTPKESGSYIEPAGQKPVGKVKQDKNVIATKRITSQSRISKYKTKLDSKVDDSLSTQLPAQYPKGARNEGIDDDLDELDVVEEPSSQALQKPQLLPVSELLRQFDKKLKLTITQESRPHVSPNFEKADKKPDGERMQVAHSQDIFKKNTKRGRSKNGSWWKLVCRGIVDAVNKDWCVRESGPTPEDDWGCSFHCASGQRFHARISMSPFFASKRTISGFPSFEKAKAALDVAKLYRKGDIRIITKLTGTKTLRIMAGDICMDSVVLSNDGVSDVKPLEEHHFENATPSTAPLTPKSVSIPSKLHIHSSGIPLGTIDFSTTKSLQNTPVSLRKEEEEGSQRPDTGCVLTYAPEAEKALFPSRDIKQCKSEDYNVEQKNNFSSPGTDSETSVVWKTVLAHTTKLLDSPEGVDANEKGEEEEDLREVTQRPSGKWQAQIFFAGRSRYIGAFKTRKEAVLAYTMVRAQLKGKAASTKNPCTQIEPQPSQFIEENRNTPYHTATTKRPVVSSRPVPNHSKRYEYDPKIEMLLKAPLHVHYSTVPLLDL